MHESPPGERERRDASCSRHPTAACSAPRARAPTCARSVGCRGSRRPRPAWILNTTDGVRYSLRERGASDSRSTSAGSAPPRARPWASTARTAARTSRGRRSTRAPLARPGGRRAHPGRRAAGAARARSCRATAWGVGRARRGHVAAAGCADWAEPGRVEVPGTATDVFGAAVDGDRDSSTSAASAATDPVS